MAGEKTRFARRAGFGVAGVAVALLLAPAFASAAVTCDFNAGTLTVTVTNGTPFPTLSHGDGTSEIIVDDDNLFNNGTVTCTTATPTDTTTSVINVDEVGSNQGTALGLDFERGRLEPGLGAEPSGIAEIEVSYQADATGDDRLEIIGATESTNQSFQFGDVGGGDTDGDLNADDDSDDIKLNAVDTLSANPGTGDDTFTGDGTGSTSFTGPTPIEMRAFGTQGNDTFRSGSAGGSFTGGPGNDSLVGGAGPDSFHMEEGNDTYDGGGGTFDFASYENTPSVDGVTLDLSQSAPQDTVGFGIDQVTNVEHAVGSNGPDRLTGTNGDNTLFGGNLTFDTGNDVLNGLGGNDTLPARAGDDTLIGGAGDDMLIGEDGSDTASFALGSTGPVTFSLNPALTGMAQPTGGAGNDMLVDSNHGGDPNDDHEIENLVGSPFGDTLTGNALANRINVLDGLLDTVDCVSGADMDEAIADEVMVDMLSNCETIDNAPQTSVTGGPANGATVSDATPTYPLQADEPASFQYRVGTGAFLPCSAACEVAALSDGTHALAFRAVDADENGSADQTPATRTVTIDATAPNTLISGKRKVKSRKKKARVIFTLTATEAGVIFECSIDGGAFFACTSPFATKLKRGKHTLTARSTDAIGNVDTSPASLTVKVVRKKRKK